MVGNKTTNGTLPWLNKGLPNFVGKKAHVLSGAFSGSIRALMLEAGFDGCETIAEADVVVFAGGADINPALYGQKPHRTTSFNDARDGYEKKVYESCLEKSIFMFGICRGAQFLHAMNGGVLWQNVNNHAGGDHMIVDIESDVRVMATSIHHQMLQHNDKLSIVAVTEERVATSFEDQNMHVILGAKDRGHELEIEAGYYAETGCFFVQGHPEIGSPEYRSWTMHKLDSMLKDWEAAGNGNVYHKLKEAS